MTGPTLWGGVVWRVSAAWVTRQHDCTPQGIEERCGGACCRMKGYWPSSAYGGVCEHLGDQGCTLSAADKPVGCHLYPLLLRRDLLSGHHIATMPNGACAGNHGRGPMMLDALRSGLVHLFGQEQFDRVRADVLAGRDSYFDVPPAVALAMEDEAALEADNLPVLPRSLRVLP